MRSVAKDAPKLPSCWATMLITLSVTLAAKDPTLFRYARKMTIGNFPSHCPKLLLHLSSIFDSHFLFGKPFSLMVQRRCCCFSDLTAVTYWTHISCRISPTVVQWRHTQYKTADSERYNGGNASEFCKVNLKLENPALLFNWSWMAFETLVRPNTG